MIARAMADHLRNAGHDVIVTHDGDHGLRKLRYERVDLAVVDLMLPQLDGWALTERARSEQISTPIIIVSARGSEHDKVHALEIGADDYLAKPFGMRELVARVHAVLRRGRTELSSEELITFEGLEIDPARQRAFLRSPGGEPHDAGLTPTEFRLLLTLARSPGRALNRDELQQRVWNVPHRGRDRSVDVCVRKLREKLGQGATHTYVQTHYGVGYRFEPVAISAEPAGSA